VFFCRPVVESAQVASTDLTLLKRRHTGLPAALAKR
jgi:hypothetical protein